MTDRRLVAEGGLMALIGLVVALIAPFGTDAMTLPLRFAYWIGGFLVGWLAFRLIARTTMAAAELLGWQREIGYALAVPLLAAGIMVTVSAMFGSTGSMWLYAQVLAVGAAFYALFFWIYARAEKRGVLVGDATPDTAQKVSVGIIDSALHSRLPASFGPILALGVEDHYVTVHGEHGAREMVLTGLADAIAEAGEDYGLRTHRSWWVANGAVAGARQERRNWVLVLTSGIEAPVSRANVAAVRAAGWLE